MNDDHAAYAPDHPAAIDNALEQECVHCARVLGPDSFEDGLRCKFCQEDDEA